MLRLIRKIFLYIFDKKIVATTKNKARLLRNVNYVKKQRPISLKEFPKNYNEAACFNLGLYEYNTLNKNNELVNNQYFIVPKIKFNQKVDF